MAQVQPLGHRLLRQLPILVVERPVFPNADLIRRPRALLRLLAQVRCKLRIRGPQMHPRLNHVVFHEAPLLDFEEGCGRLRIWALDHEAQGCEDLPGCLDHFVLLVLRAVHVGEEEVRVPERETRSFFCWSRVCFFDGG